MIKYTELVTTWQIYNNVQNVLVDLNLTLLLQSSQIIYWSGLIIKVFTVILQLNSCIGFFYIFSLSLSTSESDFYNRESDIYYKRKPNLSPIKYFVFLSFITIL